MTFDFEKNSGWINALATAMLGAALYYAQTQLIGLFAVILLFPYATLWVKEKPIWFLCSALFSAVLSWTFMDATSAVNLFLLSLSGLVMGGLIKRKTPIWQEVLLGAAALALFSVGAFLTVQWVKGAGGNPFEQLRAEIEALFSAVLETTTQSMPEEIARVADSLAISQMVQRIVRLLPGLFIAGYLFLSFTNFSFSHFVLRKTGADVRPMPLSAFQLPRGMGYAALLGALGAYLMTRLGGAWGSVGSNLNFVLLTLLFFNGLGAFDGISRKLLPGGLRIGLALVLLIGLRSWIAFVILGGLDVFWNFRNRPMPQFGGQR